jgi:hypothetical protein
MDLSLDRIEGNAEVSGGRQPPNGGMRKERQFVSGAPFGPNVTIGDFVLTNKERLRCEESCN